MLQFAFLPVGVLLAYQLAVTLLQPAWISPVTDWLQMLVAWSGLLIVVLVSRWFTQAGQLVARCWWFVSAALLLLVGVVYVAVTRAMPPSQAVGIAGTTSAVSYVECIDHDAEVFGGTCYIEMEVETQAFACTVCVVPLASAPGAGMSRLRSART